MHEQKGFHPVGCRRHNGSIGRRSCGGYAGLESAGTPAWMELCLKLWKSKKLGWALWNLRGHNGFLDSGRVDVAYEDFKGHKLDRKMLELLQGEEGRWIR